MVSAGCCNGIPQTDRLRNSKNLFLTVLGARILISGWQHVWVLVRVLSQLHTAVFSFYLHRVGKGERTLWVLLCKGSNLIHRGFTLITQSTPKAHLLTPLIGG